MQSLTTTMARRVMILARIRTMRLKFASQRFALQAALGVLAILLGVGGIGMLMLCLYTLLAQAFGMVVGALVTGATLLAMAVATMLMAARVKPGKETQLLDQLEETVVAEMSSDLAEVEMDFRRLENSARALFKGDYLSAAANFITGYK